MAKSLSSLPGRPLSKSEVLSMDGAREYCIDPDAEEAYSIVLLGDEQVHALGLDPDDSKWVQLETELVENSDDEHANAFENAIVEWVETNYGDRLGDDRDLKLVPFGDGTDDEAGNAEVPREVEMGLEPEYDCPDCDYYKTGLTTAPQSFLEHLQDEHDYSHSEAFDIFHG